MSRTPLVLASLLSMFVAGCGGGGGGGDDGGGTGKPIPGGVVHQQANLAGTNASVFAQLFRTFISGEATYSDGIVSAFGSDVPVLTLTNGAHTDPCDDSGSTTFTIANGGADLTLQYNACAEHGVTSDGRIAVSFTNVNAAARSFDYRITYTGIVFTYGASSSALSTSPSGESRKSAAAFAAAVNPTEAVDGTVTIHTEVLGSGIHTHRATVNLTRDREPEGTTFTAENLTATVQHSAGDSNGLRVTAAGGAIGWNTGFADVAYRVASDDVRLGGAQGSEVLVTLDGAHFGMHYKDAQGQDRVIVIAARNAGHLAVLDGRNDAPFIDALPDLTLNAGQSQPLSLEDYVVDPDLEPVEVTVSVLNLQPTHVLTLTKTAASVYQITASDSGVFTVRVAAVDAAAAQTTRDFRVTVYGDTDHDGELDQYDSDDDNDGVLDTNDAFPFDATESRDADLDGIGDNADADDDNDGVDDAHDAFPLDPACSTTTDSNGAQCLLTALRGFDAVFVESGVLHFVKMAEKSVQRWNPDTNAFLTPWRLGTAVPSSSIMTAATYVPAHNRFYFGYDNGAVTSVRTQVGTEQAFATIPGGVGGLANAGNFVVGQGSGNSSGTHYVFAANGALRTTVTSYYYSRTFAFNPAERRLYFFRDGVSPNDVLYEEIDQTTGLLLSFGETPYHGAYGIEPPIVVSPAGNLILIGSGNLFNAGALTWAGAVPGGIKAAQWDAGDGLIQLRASATGTTLERRDAALHVVEQRPFDGEPRAVVKVAQGYIVVTQTSLQLMLTHYQPSDDTDGDGVLNTVDAFPLDAAASIDTDSDGYPDRWNGGKSQADSTTGLVLDAYPTESACYLPQHGDGTTCNIESTLPNYEPDRVVGDANGIVYLLSAAHNRVYRYSGLAAKHLSPIVVGSDALLNGTAPTRMEYSPQHARLYFGYESGAVTYVDLTDAQLRERPFANVATRVGGIGAAGEFVAVQDYSGAWATHYYFDRNGAVKSSAEWNYYSRDYEWNATLRRLFFFRDDQSPDDLHFEQIGTTGTIDSKGETPYHGDYGIAPPIVMSPDDQYVLIGSGNIFRSSDLTWYRSVLSSFSAAIWDHNGKVTTAQAVGGTTRIYRYDANQAWLSEETRAGTPLALLENANGYLLVTSNGTKPAFAVVSR